MVMPEFVNVPGDVGIDEQPRREVNFLDFDVDRIGASRSNRPSADEGKQFIFDRIQQTGAAPSPKEVTAFNRGEYKWSSDIYGGAGVPGDAGTALPGAVEPPPEFAPTNREVLGNFAPVQVYKAKVEDYLRGRIEQDAPEVKRYTDQLEAELKELDRQRLTGEIDQKEYNRQALGTTDQIEQALLATGLMTEELAQKFADEAQTGIDRGTPPGELPFFIESQGTTGARLGELLNQGLEISKAAAGQPTLTQSQRYDESKTAAQAGRATQEEGNVQTGTEERDYYGLVQGLGLAPEVQQYMMGRFNEFYFQWLDTGPTMRFLDWLRIQMGG